MDALGKIQAVFDVDHFGTITKRPLGTHPSEPAGRGQRDPEHGRKAELKAGAGHAAHSTTRRPRRNQQVARPLPAAHWRGMLVGMAKPLAKLVSMLTPKRRWAQFSLATMFVVVTAVCLWLGDYVNPIRRLERQLRDPDEEERMIAAQRLGDLGAEARLATNSLLRAMGDASPLVRKRAVWALSRVSGRPELLTQFLTDSQDEVRLAAAEGMLWAGGDFVAVRPTLLELDQVGYFQNVDDLLSALGPDQAAAVIPLLLDKLAFVSIPQEKAAEEDERIQQDGYEARDWLQCLSVPSPTVVPGLINRLDHERPEVRKAAAEQLLRIGVSAKQAAPALRARLDDADPAVRAAIAAALGAVDPEDDEFLAVLKHALHSDDVELVHRAACYVWVLGPVAAGALDDLLVILCDPRYEMGMGAGSVGSALMRLGPPAVSSLDRTLMQAWADRERSLVPKMLRERLKGSGRAAMGILWDALTRVRGNRYPYSYVSVEETNAADDTPRARGRRATIRALEWAYAQATSLVLPEPRWATASILGMIGPPARASVPTLVAALDDAVYRDNAIHALGGIGRDAAPAVPRLARFLDSDDRILRHSVFSVLEKIGAPDESARAFIRPWLTNSDLHERAQAALALAACGEPAEQILPTLIELAIDPHFPGEGRDFDLSDRGAEWTSPGMRETLVASIASLGAAAVPQLIDTMHSRDPKVRRVAVLALGGIGPAASASVPRLMELLDDDQVWDAAAEALGHIGDEAHAAVPKLVEALKAIRIPLDPSESDADEYDPIEYLSRLHALGGIGAQAREGVPAVLRLANFEDPEIRHAAVVALARIDPANPSLIPHLRHLLVEWERKSLTDNDDWFGSGHSLPADGLAQIADAVWELGPRAERLAPDLQRIVTTAPLLDPRRRCYAAFALARFPLHRQAAEGYLEKITKSEFPPLYRSYELIHLAHAQLQRIRGATQGETRPIAIPGGVGP